MRLLNGERVRIIGVTIESSERRWEGTRVLRRTASNMTCFRKNSALSARTVLFHEGTTIKTGKIARKQTPLLLDLGLTVHKAQGMTFSVGLLRKYVSHKV